MPWYRVPTNMRARARRELAGEGNKLNVALLELLRAAAEADEPDMLHAGGIVHIDLGRRGNRNAPPPCRICGWMSERECDRIVDRDLLVHGEPQRCDAPLCTWCTYEPEPGKDLCPQCVLLFKAWLAARTNSTDGEGPA